MEIWMMVMMMILMMMILMMILMIMMMMMILMMIMIITMIMMMLMVMMMIFLFEDEMSRQCMNNIKKIPTFLSNFQRIRKGTEGSGSSLPIELNMTRPRGMPKEA